MNAGEHILSENSRLKRENKELKRVLIILIAIMLIASAVLVVILTVFAPEIAHGRDAGTSGAAASPSTQPVIRTVPITLDRRSSSREEAPPARHAAAPADNKSGDVRNSDLSDATSGVPVRQVMRTLTSAARIRPVLATSPDIYIQALNYIHFRESRYGKDPKSKRGCNRNQRT